MASLIQPKFKEFVYTIIGEQQNGTPLTILSALVRLNRDPWEEAERLARLPKDTATRDLALLIGALPETRLHASACNCIALQAVDRLREPKRRQVRPRKSNPLSSELIWAAALSCLVSMTLLSALSAWNAGSSEFTSHAAATLAAPAPRPVFWRSPGD
jgi:hypothetical protein